MLSSSGDSGVWCGAGVLKGVARGFLPPLPLPKCLEDIRGSVGGTQLIKVIQNKYKGDDLFVKVDEVRGEAVRIGC